MNHDVSSMTYPLNIKQLHGMTQAVADWWKWIKSENTVDYYYYFFIQGDSIHYDFISLGQIVTGQRNLVVFWKEFVGQKCGNQKNGFLWMIVLQHIHLQLSHNFLIDNWLQLLTMNPTQLIWLQLISFCSLCWKWSWKGSFLMK